MPEQYLTASIISSLIIYFLQAFVAAEGIVHLFKDHSATRAYMLQQPVLSMALTQENILLGANSYYTAVLNTNMRLIINIFKHKNMMFVNTRPPD